MAGGEELSSRLPSLVSVWASVTKFEMIRRAWASHALLYNTPINREGGEFARWDMYRPARTTVSAPATTPLEPDGSRGATDFRGFGTYRLKTKSRPCLVGAIHVALSELGAKRGGSVAGVGVGISRARSLPRIVPASNSTSSFDGE